MGSGLSSLPVAWLDILTVSELLVLGQLQLNCIRIPKPL